MLRAVGNLQMHVVGAYTMPQLIRTPIALILYKEHYF